MVVVIVVAAAAVVFGGVFNPGTNLFGHELESFSDSFHAYWSLFYALVRTRTAQFAQRASSKKQAVAST